jgi:hypothetical protein
MPSTRATGVNFPGESVEWREGRIHLRESMKLGSGARTAAGLVAGFLGLSLWMLHPGSVRPPPSVSDPVTVRLIVAGRHSGLLLPVGGGRVVEYGYGEWIWYALGKDDWWRAPATVLWPCPGTLGRRFLREADLESMGETYGFARVSSFAAERRDVARLLAHLDADFAAGGTPHHSDLYDMDFVRYPERFWFAHDCHDETAEWLRELGCFVPPVPIRIELSLRAPSD